MRILFTSYPAYGHVNAMLPLARQARGAGHEVAFPTGAELVPEIERRGLDTWQVGPSRAEVDAWVRAAHPNLEQLPVEQRTRMAAPVLFIESAAKRAVELVPRRSSGSPKSSCTRRPSWPVRCTACCCRTAPWSNRTAAPASCSAHAHGLPQLILPQGADQFTNATTCQSAGAALALRPDELSADAVAAAAERLITDPAFRHAAAGIQAEIDAMPSACDVLCVLVYGCAS
ncbi:MAG TPA: nucleotide disphospho-sugar-binding domain-containing protein [Pseudonocardiaceae bacterium]